MAPREDSMNSTFRPSVFSFILLCLAFAGVLRAADGPIVMLKLDDLARQGKEPTATVTARWQRVADYLEKEKIKASFGLLVASIDGDCPTFADWIKQRVATGMIEIWDHGYYTSFPDE